MTALAERLEDRPEEVAPETGGRLLLPTRSDPSLAAHVARYGPLRDCREGRESLLAAVEGSGLTGRGGAGFPTARKLRAVGRGRNPVVVANGVEGEPPSAKDAVLLTSNPHLVLDGALIAADVVGAREAIIALTAPALAGGVLEGAIAERAARGERRLRVAVGPDRFLAGEESALVGWIDGGPAKPTYASRPWERGVGGRPTLVQNVETLANLALIARFGAEWFRRAGTAAEPGTVLVTAGGAVARPGVVEVQWGTPIDEVLARFGGTSGDVQAFLVGGYFGTWQSAAELRASRLAAAALAEVGASPGARTIVALPAAACGVRETARVAAWLARESAGQCGPCLFGLARIAQSMTSIARCEAGSADAARRLQTVLGHAAGRGACRHPDGAVRLVRSALSVFAGEIAAHIAGRCTAATAEPVLPAPDNTPHWR